MGIGLLGHKLLRKLSRAPQAVTLVDAEDRRKHLDLIQSAVNRMAGASANAKSWLLPVVTAAFGFAVVEAEPLIGLLGLSAVLLFAFVDAQYLRQERAFRALYRAAVNGNVAIFEMSPARYFNKPNRDGDDTRTENCRWGKVIWSWSLAGFYAPMMVIGAGLTAISTPWEKLTSLIC